MPFDNEARAAKRLRKLKIGIVGFGNFGQFLAKRFIDNDHAVIATSRGDYSDAAKKMGARYFPDPDDFCEQHPDVVIFATSILSTEATINSFPVQRLRRNTLVADVLSVKQFPKQLFLQRLPDDFDIVCLHPMFGPDSGKGTWKNLPLVYDKVRIGEEQPRRERVDNLLVFSRMKGAAWWRCRARSTTGRRRARSSSHTPWGGCSAAWSWRIPPSTPRGTSRCSTW
jgi:arogenate dehydrogenase (NADP+)